ncbi:MAG TPA: PQQ-binding-like beta-propeller repeat protein [Candidatus Polarisedimenticolia bacterium]|nr:PQQ-binding-like beta-propeller repeat protein [Candidatus Polarisedimenticolia bacterium]
MRNRSITSIAGALCAGFVLAAVAAAAPSPADEKAKPAAAPASKAPVPTGPPAMFGGTPARNMVSSEKGLPEKWDIHTGLNVKWSAALGSQSYAGPVVYGGKVFVGTNNEGLRNPKLKNDRGVVMAFNADDGTFLWQATHPKLPSGMVNDWPLQGVCSTPYVEGDRLYYVSNRAEIVCADTEGFRDGENDGPFTTETDTGETDADIIWKYDMMGELDVFPHNLAAGNPLVVGDLIFTVTGNGVDEGHVNIPSPTAPSFIAVNKNTAKLAWENASPGEKILHGSWSNPAYGVIKGRPQVIIPGGDGWVYSFVPETGKLLWKFDANPKDAVYVLGGSGTRNEIIATPVIWEDKVYVAVGQDPEHGEGIGHLWAIDATKDGDVTETGKVWHRGNKDFHRTISTVAISDGLLYAADLSGFLYCLDARTGEHFWTHDLAAAVWGSPFVADGRVYIGDEDGDVTVLRAGKKKELIGEMNMGNAVYTTPVAKDGVLYIVSRSKIFALKNGIPAAAPAAKPTTKP